MPCFSAWADRASAPRCGRKRSAPSPAARSCSCSTRRIRRRSGTSSRESTSRRRSFSSRASRARRSSRTSSRRTSSTACARPWAPPKPAAASSPSPIRARASRSGPGPTASATSSRVSRAIGGRYSALSNFGMVPAAVMGLDVERLLGEAARMKAACAPGVPAAENPGVVLGTILGVLGNGGTDKVTLVASPGDPRPRGLARAAARRIHGERGQGPDPGGSRDARPRPRRLRRRPRLRLPAARRGPDPAQDAAIGGPRDRSAGRWSVSVCRRAFDCRRVLSLGDCNGGGRLGAGNQPLQPARRRSEQGRDAGADRTSTRRRARCPPRRLSSRWTA